MGRHRRMKRINQRNAMPRATHHLKPLMDFDRRVRSRLNQQDGRYRFDPMVPISEINLPPVWNKYRYEDNKKKMRETGSVPPVFLTFIKTTQRYEVEDGIQRIHSAKDLGYKHIPAIIYYED